MFKRKHSFKPSKYIGRLEKYLEEYSSSEEVSTETQEGVTKELATIRAALYGEPDKEPDPDVVETVVSMLIDPESELLFNLFQYFTRFDVDTRSDFARIVSCVMRHKGTLDPVKYVLHRPEILKILIDAYDLDSNSALTAGLILRDCLKSERISKHVLDTYLEKLFEQTQVRSFDIGSDAFATLKTLLTQHKRTLSTYLTANYDDFFAKYRQLLLSENYVTRRQSVKLLAEMLLDQANFALMKKYIADADNLKLMMKLLIDPNKSIQFEAFHVFKVFVANPKKSESEGVMSILTKNKDKMIAYLSDFQNDRDGQDDQFKDEKQLLIRELKRL
ncbi:Mo25-like [Carpediemonas membranifera]|uniref:Mo25-like n=1 Tax=Carpediemonas membranifera TaxID=201153 RepID=A0A8J6EBJ2_9EUKA|nr:Mo25-like [Carpediemonas membranifera]|eukprot:KAG9397330.1 Mo25-like [Carpediemonas membranifera]